MVDQKRLLEKFNNFTIDTLPHSIILEGKYGSGKHMFSKLIAKQFNLEFLDKFNKIDYDTIMDLNSRTIPILCIINSEDITVKEESSLLKFIEEPLANIFIIICTENTNKILPTILNRCQIYRFEDYTKEFLMEFYNNHNSLNLVAPEVFFEIADTPGKILQWKDQPFEEIIDYCNKIFDKIALALPSNILKISNTINFEEEQNNSLYNFDLFIEILLYIANKRCKENSYNAFAYYIKTNKLYNDIKLKTNRKYLFEHYLYELKGIN